MNEHPSPQSNEHQKTKKSFELPLYITLSMRALRVISGKLALKFALKLFFTPLKFSRPNREDEVYHSAEKKILKTNKGDEFTCYNWGKSNNKVLLVHGWSGRGTQFFGIINTLLQNSYEVVSIDAPAHGGSKKPKTSLLEFVDCIEKVHETHGPFIAGVGHSLGGAAILNSLNRNTKIPKVVTVGTPSSIKNVVRDFCKKTSAGPKIAKRIISYIENRYKLKSEEVSPNYLAQLHQPKGLIVHDELDLDIGIDEAHILHHSWSNSNLLITKGLGHRKVLNDSAVIQRIMDFIKN